MTKWYQKIIETGEKETREYDFRNKSLRAYELFKKNKYKSVDNNIEVNSSTNKMKNA